MVPLLLWLLAHGDCAFVDQVEGGVALVVTARGEIREASPGVEGTWRCAVPARRAPVKRRNDSIPAGEVSLADLGRTR
jgi:hypothetical protein